MIKFTVFGATQAQERSGNQIRAGKSGKQYVHHYDQPKSADFKKLVQLYCMEAMSRAKQRDPLEGMLVLSIRVYRKIPKAFGKVKRVQAVQGDLRPITKPDLKNYIWGIEDSLNGIAWKDDSQIISFDGSGKYYTDGTERAEVEIRQWAGDIPF